MELNNRERATRHDINYGNIYIGSVAHIFVAYLLIFKLAKGRILNMFGLVNIEILN